jgi:hypothetical protein
MANSFLEERETPEYDSLMSLAEQIVLRLPGCDDEMVRKAISSSYRDFVKRSCLFRTRQEIELSKYYTQYLCIPMTIDCVVDCVTRVFDDGYELDNSLYMFSNGNCCFDCSVLPPEGKTRKVVVECLESPFLGTERAPAMFVRQYGDAIVSGVLWKLMAMQGKPWSDPQQAAMCAVEYENALTENRMRHYGNSAGGANYFKRGLLI